MNSFTHLGNDSAYDSNDVCNPIVGDVLLFIKLRKGESEMRKRKQISLMDGYSLKEKILNEMRVSKTDLIFIKSPDCNMIVMLCL